MNAIEVKEISFAYDKGGPTCGRFSFSIRQGKMTSILGPNGCGKTTLLKLMSRLLVSQEGEIYLEGSPLKSLDSKTVAQKVTYVPSQISPLFSLSVIDFVLMGRAPYLKGFCFPAEADEQIAEESLSYVGLLEYRDRQLQTLSSGEKQRALIAKALTQSTPILLLDEPTAHLDLKYQIETLALLKSLQKKKNLTYLIVLHDFHLANEWSDEVILIQHGKIFAQGFTKDVLTEKNILEVFEVKVAIDENPYLIKDS